MAAKAKPKGLVGKHRWLVFGVIAVVAVLGYLWWRNRGASAGSAQSSGGAPWWQTEGATGGATGSGGAPPPVVPGPGGNGGGSGGGGSDGGGNGTGDTSYPGSPTFAVTELTHARIMDAKAPALRTGALERYLRATPTPVLRSGALARMSPSIAPQSTPTYAAAPAQQYETQVPAVVGGGGRLVDV